MEFKPVVTIYWGNLVKSIFIMAIVIFLITLAVFKSKKIIKKIFK